MNSDHEQSLADDEEIVSAVIIQEPVAPPMTAVECESQSADFQPDLIKDPPATWREIGAMILLVMLCDLTIYRGHGFAGYALLFATAPLLLALGAVRRALTIPFAVVVVMPRRHESCHRGRRGHGIMATGLRRGCQSPW